MGRIVARTDAAGDVTRRLMGRLNRRVRKRAAAIVAREVGNAGIAVGRQFLRGLLPGGPVTGFAIDFLASEIRREVSPRKVANAVAKSNSGGVEKLLTGFDEDLRAAEILDRDRKTRLAGALSDRFLSQVRNRFTPEIADALAPALGDNLADLTASEIRSKVRTVYVEKALTADYAEISRYLDDLVSDRATQIQAIKKAANQGRRFAIDTMLRKVRNVAGARLASTISANFGLDRDISAEAARELVAGIRRTNIRDITNIIAGNVTDAKEQVLEDVDVLREQLSEVAGTDPSRRLPGESDADFLQRQRQIQKDLRNLNAAEVSRNRQVKELGTEPIKALPPWRDSWSFPTQAQRPLTRKPTAPAPALGTTGEPIVTPAPKIAGILPSTTLRDVNTMTRDQLLSELEWLKQQGQPVPRKYMSVERLREAVARHRYGAYPGVVARWPKEALPNPRSLTFSQLSEQLTELKENGFDKFFRNKSGKTISAWWANERKMRFILGRIRRAQFNRNPELRPPKPRRLKGRPPETEVTIVPGSGEVLQLPPPPKMLTAQAGPSGPVRPIPDIDGMTYNQMQTVVKQLREAGYDIPEVRTKASLSNYLKRMRAEGVYLPGAEPPKYTVRTAVPAGELPFEQRWKRLINETDAAYIARMRGLIAHKTGEVPRRAEIEGQQKYINRLAKTYETLQGNLRTPMEGWEPIPADPYTPLPKEQRWKRIAGEAIDDYTARLSGLFQQRRGFSLQQLPEETKTQFLDRLRSSVRNLQETPPRGRATFSMPSAIAAGSKRRYQYDPHSKLYLDVKTGKYRERFIFDGGVGQYRDLSTGQLISTRKIRSILRQSGQKAEEIIGVLNRALIESDAADIEFKPSQLEQQRRVETKEQRVALLEKQSRTARGMPETVFKASVPNPFRNIELADFEREMVAELRDHYAQQFTLGAGGVDALDNAIAADVERRNRAIPASVEPEVRRQREADNRIAAEAEVLRPLKSMTAQQMTRLDAMMKLVQGGSITAAQMFARSILYAKAGKIAFNLGNRLQQKIRGNNEERRVLGDVEHCADCIAFEKLGWQPLGTLPMPGEKSVCGSNCYCRMEYRSSQQDGISEHDSKLLHFNSLSSLLRPHLAV